MNKEFRQQSKRGTHLMESKSWVKFALLGLLWGSNFLWIRIAVTDIGPYLLVFFRILLAFAFMLTFAITSRTRMILTWRWAGISLILGVFNVTLPFLLTSWAEQFIASGLAGIINSTYPLFGFLFAAIFLGKERSSPSRILGLLAGFGGAVLVASTGFPVGNQITSVPAVYVMLMAPVSYAIALNFARLSMNKMTMLEQSFGQICFALITVSIAAGLLEPNLRFPSSPTTWISILWLGILCTGVGTLLWYSLLNSAGATLTSLIAYLSPIIAVILGALVLSEKFTWQFIVGGSLITMGVFWVNDSRLNPEIPG